MCPTQFGKQLGFLRLKTPKTKIAGQLREVWALEPQISHYQSRDHTCAINSLEVKGVMLGYSEPLW